VITHRTITREVFLKLRKRIINAAGFEKIMFPEDTEKLVDSLEKHVAEYFTGIDRNTFIAHLKSCGCMSSAGYELIKKSEIDTFEQMVKMHKNAHKSLKLKYSIFNKGVNDHAMSKAKAWAASLPSKIGINLFPPEICSIFSNPGIREILRASESTFSVLGEYTVHFYGGSDKILYVSRRPVLVVPGAELHDTINKWESDHTKYYKEPGNPFFKGLKRISYHQFPNCIAES
jgi:hypothetical protein